MIAVCNAAFQLTTSCLKSADICAQVAELSQKSGGYFPVRCDVVAIELLLCLVAVLVTEAGRTWSSSPCDWLDVASILA